MSVWLDAGDLVPGQQVTSLIKIQEENNPQDGIQIIISRLNASIFLVIWINDKDRGFGKGDIIL